jgi:hypothetical protein
VAALNLDRYRVYPGRTRGISGDPAERESIDIEREDAHEAHQIPPPD